MNSLVSLTQDIPGVRGVVYRLDQAQRPVSFALRGLTNYLRWQLAGSRAKRDIAAVMVGRNDDYMADFRERLQATIAWNLRYFVNEVVFVEWNPTPDRELLALGLTKMFPSLRAYVVPSAVHNALCENANVKLLEYHAKNVGIRRARSDWVMATNADAAVGFDTANRIFGERLDPNVIWTAERIDIPWAEGAQDRISLTDSMRFKRFIPYERLGTGEFALASRDLWHRARGYDEKMVRHRIGCDVRGVAQMVEHGGEIRRAGTVLHLTHPTSCTENIQPHHGELATVEGVPYANAENWGLGDRREVEIAERVWQLE